MVEHYVGVPEATNFRHAATRLRLDQDARITHLKLQQESGQAWHLGEIDATQGRGSYFASHSVSLGARLARHDIATHFAGERCETLLNGLYCVDQRRHVDHHTLIGHEKPRCVSHESYRGIMADAAHRILTSDARTHTGNFYIDEEVLKAAGEKDFSRYAVKPGTPLFHEP